MWKDPIVEEVRRIREEHAARQNYDLDAIFSDLRESQDRGGREVVRLEPRVTVDEHTDDAGDAAQASISMVEREK